MRPTGAKRLVLLSIAMFTAGALSLGLVISIAAFFDGDVFRIKIVVGGLCAVLVSLIAIANERRAWSHPEELKNEVVGANALVIERFLPAGAQYRGAVMIQGERWKAVSRDSHEVGDNIVVRSRSGLLLHVEAPPNNALERTRD